MVLKPRSKLEEQHQWYRSQPVSYRRLWWAWAAEQPNFDQMVKSFIEEDQSVIRMRDLWVEKRGRR